MSDPDKLQDSRPQYEAANPKLKTDASGISGGRGLRWLSLCVALSAVTAALALLLLLRHGLPLSFSGSLLFALLVGVGLPALVSLAVTGRTPERKLSLAQLWSLVCVPIAVILIINLFI